MTWGKISSAITCAPRRGYPAFCGAEGVKRPPPQRLSACATRNAFLCEGVASEQGRARGALSRAPHWTILSLILSVQAAVVMALLRAVCGQPEMTLVTVPPDAGG